MLYKCSFLSLILIMGFQASVLANDFSKGILNLKKTVESAKSVTTEKYPNSDTAVINRKIICKINKEGTGSQWDDKFIKILTRQGVENNKIQSLSYMIPYTEINFLLVELIKPDGSVHQVDIKNQSRTMIDPYQMNENIFNPDCKIIEINIPDLQVGDIIRLLSVTKFKKAQIKNTWNNIYEIQSTSPIIKEVIIISASKSLPIENIVIQNKIKNTIKFTKESDNDAITYKWTLKDVPRFFPEKNMPRFKGFSLLLVTTIQDWKFISNWYWVRWKPKIYAANKAMIKKVKELTGNCNTELDKIKALYYYVSDNIRYLQTKIDKNAYANYVNDASYTFDNKAGICRNKAVLLVSMLRLAGFKAFPVCVSFGMQVNRKAPMPDFNHCIAALELKPNEYTLLDPTIGDRSKQIFPSWLSNTTYLVCKPKGETLRIVPPLPAEDNIVSIKTSLTINKSNRLSGKTTIKPKGLNSMIWRNYFSSIPQERRQIFINEILQQALPNTKLSKLTFDPDNLLNMQQELQIEFEFSNSEPLIWNNNTAVMNLPWLGGRLDALFPIQDFGLRKRTFPLKFISTSGFEEKISVNDKAAEFEPVSLPKSIDLNSKDITYVQKYAKGKKEIKAQRKFLNKTMELSPKEYLSYRKDLGKIESILKTPLILERTESKVSTKYSMVSPFDQKFIKKHIKLEIKNNNSWCKKVYIKKKILSHTKLRQNSELKIPYNPVWESVNVTNAFTVLPNGKKIPVRNEDIHIMDASWSASAPRYPEGKILVVNFPGVDVNSIIEYQLEYNSKNKPFFSEQVQLNSTNPIDDFKLTVIYPEDIKLNINTSNLIGVNTYSSNKNGKIITEWSSEKLEGNIFEVNTPPEWVYNPTIFLSTGTWEQYCSKLKLKLLDSVSSNTEIKKLAAKLVENCNTETEKLINIRNYIAKNVRIAGPEFINIPISNISKANITLNDGYGNYADRAVLLYSILRLKGVEPEFVLVSRFPYIDLIVSPLLETPQRTLFDTVLLRVKTGNGYIYLNDTTQYSKLGATPSQFHLGLNINDNSLISIDPLKNMETGFVKNFNINLNDDSSARYQGFFKYFGKYYEDNNKSFTQLKPERRSQFYQQFISDISHDAEPVSKLITNFNKYPGEQSFTAKINDFSSLSKDFCYFRTLVEISDLFKIGSETRYYPFYLSTPINRRYNINVKLLKEYDKALIIPENKVFYMPNNSGTISVKSDVKRNIKGESTYNENININIKPSIYTPQQYQDILKIYYHIISTSINTLLFSSRVFID